MLGFFAFSVQYPLFCKVHDILLHKRFSKVEELVRNSQESVVNETKIVDHLKAYLNRRNVRIFTEGSVRYL